MNISCFEMLFNNFALKCNSTIICAHHIQWADSFRQAQKRWKYKIKDILAFTLKTSKAAIKKGRCVSHVSMELNYLLTSLECVYLNIEFIQTDMLVVFHFFSSLVLYKTLYHFAWMWNMYMCLTDVFRMMPISQNTKNNIYYEQKYIH